MPETEVLKAMGEMTYLTVKAIHLIGAVCWFAGLFYGVRLFVYHAEAGEKPEAEPMFLQFELMTRRLWNGIATPAMVVTVIFGVWLLTLYGQMKQGWIHFKLLQLVLLVVYHVMCLRIMKAQRARTSRWDAQQLRVLNEVPTLLLVGIIVAAVFKTYMTPTVMTVTLLILGLLLALAIWGYRRARLARSAAADG